MQKNQTMAEVYMTRPVFTPLDIAALIGTVLAIILFFVFWFTLWLSLPVIVCFATFLVSHSDYVSDKEYEHALTHLLQFNTVRESRSEGYEALLRFHEQGYLKKDFKQEYSDFYLSGYDLQKGLVRYGLDGVSRSTVYRLTHLHFTPTHCHYHTCEADMVTGTVTEQKLVVPLDECATITEKVLTVSGHRVTARSLALPHCPPVPVAEQNDELAEILSHFKAS